MYRNVSCVLSKEDSSLDKALVRNVQEHAVLCFPVAVSDNTVSPLFYSIHK
jgi:hypothetical protein